MPIYVASNFMPKSLGTFPLVEDTYLLGGFRAVATLVDRDGITTLRRRVGMLVFVQSDGRLYQLDADLTTWRDFYEVGGAHTHPNADFEDGFMTAADKAKLDGIEEGANAYEHPVKNGDGHVPETNGDTAGQILVSGPGVNDYSWQPLPALTITNTHVVASEAEMLALSVEPGDVAVRTDISQTFILRGPDATVASDWQELLTPAQGVTSVSAVAPVAVTGDAKTPTISMPAADAAQSGYLSAADWNTFNSKGTVTNVTGTGAISVSNGPTTPTISIAAATTSVPGTMSATDKSKLDGISSGANAYTHPTGDGNLHVPATSTTNSGKVLTAGAAAGSLSWAAPVATTANLRVNSLGVGTASSGTAGDVRATGDVTAFYSDGRLKTVIGTIDNALEKVMSLRGVIYTGNEVAAKYGYPTDVRMSGVIAQDVQAVLPEVIAPAPFDVRLHPEGGECSRSGEDYLTVKYDRMVPLLIEAIKEQQQQIEELKSLLQK